MHWKSRSTEMSQAGAGEMAQQVRVLLALAEGPGVLPVTACHSSSREAEALLHSMGTCTHMVHVNTHRHINNKNSFALHLVLQGGMHAGAHMWKLRDNLREWFSPSTMQVLGTELR